MPFRAELAVAPKEIAPRKSAEKGYADVYRARLNSDSGMYRSRYKKPHMGARRNGVGGVLPMSPSPFRESISAAPKETATEMAYD